MYMYRCIYNVKIKVIKTCAPPGVNNSCHDRSLNFSLFVEKKTFAPPGVNSCHDCLFYFSSFV